MSEAAQPAETPATPAEPDTIAPGPDVARMRAAMALLDEEQAPESPPESPAEPQQQAEPAKSEPAEPEKTEPEKLPSLAELEAEVAKRRQAKPPPQATPPQPTQEQVAQAAQTQQQAAAIRAIPVENFQQDPVAALRDHGLSPRDVLQTMARAAFGAQQQQQAQPQQPTQDVDALVAAKVKEALGQWQENWEAQQLAARQAQEDAQAEREFIDLSGDGGTYKLLSRLSVEERIWHGNRVADLMLELGQQPTLAQIAQTIENDLAERFGPPGSPGPGANHQSAAGSDPTAPNGATTLSQSMPATAPTNPTPRTEEERIQAAIRVAQAGD